jgi:subfamily B ATP-binding cassette protein MsbA
VRRVQAQIGAESDQFVLQDTLLFYATIWENIAYGRPDASPAEVKRAAELAGASEFIEAMRRGLRHDGRRAGRDAFRGQRQRIAIARAIVRDSPILVLDEPTSGLDAASEQSVIAALDTLMKGRTVMVIAHHLGTIRHADVIFVINEAEGC